MINNEIILEKMLRDKSVDLMAVEENLSVINWVLKLAKKEII